MNDPSQQALRLHVGPLPVYFNTALIFPTPHMNPQLGPLPLRDAQGYIHTHHPGVSQGIPTSC